VSPVGAIALGAVGGVIVVLGLDLLEWLRIDDPIGRSPYTDSPEYGNDLTRPICKRSIWADGPTAADNSAPLRGAVLRRRYDDPGGSADRSLIVTGATFGSALVVMYALNLPEYFASPPKAKRWDWMFYEHGLSAYPEYMITEAYAPVPVVKA